MTCTNESCVFVYLYRDAGNYKAGAQLLLDGAYTVSVESTSHHCCDMFDHFVAEQVGIPPLYADLYPYSSGPTIHDIAFHEFSKLRPATQEDHAALAR